MSLQSFPIVGLTKGLQTNTKPAMLPDQAFALLDNAVTWRERVLKREQPQLLGRLRRVITNETLSKTSGTAVDTFYLSPGLVASEPDASIQPGSAIITVDVGGGAQSVFEDNGDGTLTKLSGPLTVNGAIINYMSTAGSGIGNITFYWNSGPGAGLSVSVDFSYYPSLPVMGLLQRELPTINDEQTVAFDTKYAYIISLGPPVAWQEFIAGTTWTGADYNLFWGYNYLSSPNTRLLFVSNFNQLDPIRYTDGSSWNNFTPLATSLITIFQAKIIISYYNRLIFLNTWEGTTAGGAAAATNFFNRCRFSQIGDPTQIDAYRVDIFGKGGSLDAPTDEAITGATFVKNTLVVDFERSTWQLRYVGEYGMPFVWERISSDFGSGSGLAGVLFDNQRLTVGDVGITAANGSGADRIDLVIPSQVFNIEKDNNGQQRITGIRDYQKELIFWNYPEDEIGLKFPNKVLVYNYRNNSWAIYRDSITYFGSFYSPAAGGSGLITWDSLTTLWDDNNVTWDDASAPGTGGEEENIIAGNQKGFVFFYGYYPTITGSSSDINQQVSLPIDAFDLSSRPFTLKSSNHNLITGELIYISGLVFIHSTAPYNSLTTTLNDAIYRVSVIDSDTFTISKWDATAKDYDPNFAYSFTPSTPAVSYQGGGQAAVLPRMNITTKDVNIFQGQSLATKLSTLDFLFKPVDGGAVSIQINRDAPPPASGVDVVVAKPLQLWNRPSMPIDSQYSWFRFYQTLSAQYFNISVAYNENQMNTIQTHIDPCELYAINAWCRPGGRSVFGGS